MNQSIEYALGALLLYGLADFVYKRGAAAGAEPHHFLMVQTWFFTPCALLYGLASGTLAFNAAALWGATAGVCAVVGYYNFAHSLRSGSVSTNATIFRLSFAVTVALAVVVLHEPLTTPKLAGLAPLSMSNMKRAIEQFAQADDHSVGRVYVLQHERRKGRAGP